MDLEQSERHGDWQHHAFVTAMERHRWATLLGMRTFIRYDDVAALFKERRLREAGLDWLAASGITEGPLFEWWRLIMFTNEGEAHRRLRSLVSTAFAARGVQSLRPAIAAIAADLCERLREAETPEFVDDFAHWMPVRAVCHLLGIPGEDVPIFEGWSSDLGKVFSLAMTAETRARLDAAIVELSDYVRVAIADRRRHPRDDLVTALVAARDARDRLSEAELVAMVANLILGGHDTTKYAIASSILALLRRPAEWRKLLGDPGAIPDVVEEALRLESSVPWLSRVATEPFVLRDLSFDAGERVLVSPLGANHDPARFPDPVSFDSFRRGAEPLTFGLGPHFCIGAALARIEVEESLTALVARFPEMELAEDTIVWTPLLEFRGPLAFRVTLGSPA